MITNQTCEFGRKIWKRISESRYFTISLLLHLTLLLLLGSAILYQQPSKLHDFIADGGSVSNGLMGQGEDGTDLTTSDSIESIEEDRSPPDNSHLIKVDVVALMSSSDFRASLAHPS